MVGMAYPAINDEKFYSGLFPMPPLAEQKRIVEKVDSLMKLCDDLESKIEKQKNYSNRLMESIIKSSLAK
ncbi:type I restriction-modification system subunit S [Clostridium sartagoforme AAU1]|nr:restriction endonuclease subunit S [Clostridium sartagoforme]EOR20163.1 type I restriction-modification system subunit S [Clostridium sartagoforme AAU1]